MKTGYSGLFIPGPTNIPEKIMQAMTLHLEDMRAPDFGGFTLGLLNDLKKVFKTKTGQPMIFPCSGTGGWESALTNTLNPGDKIRLLQITSSEAEAEKTRAGLEKLLADVRVKATPKPVIRREGEGVPEAIARTSGDADLTIIGMQMPTETNAQELAERVHKLINPLGSVLMVRSAETEDVLSGETVMIPALPG